MPLPGEAAPECVAQRQHSPAVHVEHVQLSLQRRIHKWARRAVARRRDQQADVKRLRRVNERRHRRLVREVCRHDTNLDAVPFDQFSAKSIQYRLSPSDQNQVLSLSGQPVGNRPANTVGRAGNQRPRAISI